MVLKLIYLAHFFEKIKDLEFAQLIYNILIETYPLDDDLRSHMTVLKYW